MCQKSLIETRYYGECEHPWTQKIRSDSCLKRYYNILDYKNDNTFTLCVCNDHMKLLVNKWMHENPIDVRYTSSKELAYNTVLKEIIESEISLNTSFRMSSMYAKEGKLNPTIRIPVCTRPYMIDEYSFFEALKLFSNTKSVEIYNALKVEINNKFQQVAEYMLTYVKYKTDHKKIKQLQKDFSEQIFYGTKSIDTISKIIELIIKYNIKNLKR